jgi:trimeric autotransporter adhesin
MNRRALSFILCHLLFAIVPAAAAPLSGTRFVGPTGDYASITAALTDVQTQTLSGPLVLELQPAYISTVETFPLVFGNLGTTDTNTLTIRPASDAVNLSITSADTTAATIDLNGAQFVTIDGRPGGVGSHAGSGGGSASQLTIANTSTSGRALRFINEASNNTLRYTTLQGVSTSATSGVVVFSTTTGANGNDNNSLDHCDLGDGASMPTNGLFSLGTATTIDQYNSGNTVSNCNIFNFYSAAIRSAGLLLDGGNTAWSITGNSFYQTASLGPLADHYAIHLWCPSGGNFTVTGNFIGGSAANAGGTAWTKNSQFLGVFQGIYLNVGTTTPSSVQGNTIANMICATNASAGSIAWCGIFVSRGNVNIGTVTGNTIGSGTGTDSISVSTSGQGGTCFGIYSLSTDTVVISNNTIGAINHERLGHQRLRIDHRHSVERRNEHHQQQPLGQHHHREQSECRHRIHIRHQPAGHGNLLYRHHQRQYYR